MTPSEALRLIEIDIETMFVFDEAGRILRQGAPDGSAGPRFCLWSCAGGVQLRFGREVAAEAIEEINARIAEALPWSNPDVVPDWQEAIAAALAREAPVASSWACPIFHLPRGLAWAGETRIVVGDTDEGRALISRLAAGPWPRDLAEAGFRQPEDFWVPWVVALAGGEIAALAFAARLGRRGAEVGVFTLERFRGRRLAAAAVAAWSSLTSLEGRSLFYSTLAANRASRALAAHLGLERIGVSFSVL